MEAEERAAVALGLVAVVVLGAGFAVRAHRRGAPSPTKSGVPAIVANAAGFAACGRALASSDAALRAVEIDGCAKLEGDDLAFLGCSPSGAWSMAIERAVRRRGPAGDACGDVGLVVTLTHFGRDGSPVVVSPGASLATMFHVPEGDVKVNVSVLATPGSRHLDEPQFFDFDGDGDEEVIVTGGAEEEGYSPELHEVWTFKGGAVVGYVPALGLEFDGTLDLDGDRRPDLVGRGPHSKILAESEVGQSEPIAPRFFVYRSMPDGTFDVHSSASIAYAKTQCGPQSAVDFEGATFDDAFGTALVCARLWGTSASDLHAAADRRCHVGERCPLWVSALIDVDPPFTFR